MHECVTQFLSVLKEKSVQMLRDASFLFSHLTFLFASRLTPHNECECFEESCLRWFYFEGGVY